MWALSGFKFQQPLLSATNHSCRRENNGLPLSELNRRESCVGCGDSITSSMRYNQVS